MQDIVASCDNNRFDIEIALEQQLGIQTLPFSGMDKSGAAICVFYMKGLCQRGAICPLRHTSGNQNTVCKHWLRGLCKKGDTCEFLHEYDMSKMPECYFYQRLGQCCNKECPFLHIDPESKIKDCAWYDRGFCRHGPSCKNRHVRRVICPNYLFGFCPEGKECKFMHPRFELPQINIDKLSEKKSFTCHTCGEVGHKAAWCLKKHLYQPPSQVQVIGSGAATSQGTNGMAQVNNVSTITSTAAPTPTSGHYPQHHQQQHHQHHQHNQRHQHQHHQQRPYDPTNRHPQLPENYVPGQRRPLDQVTCFKCGDKGHYANRCPKGHLAFLHNADNQAQQQH